MAIQLMKNEEILWQSHEGQNYRKYILVRDSILALLIMIVTFFVLSTFVSFISGKLTFFFIGIVFIISIITIAVNQFMLFTNLYVITNERVIIKRGWLNRRITSIRLENIIDTKAEQNFRGRLIKSGTIYLFTANDSQNSDDEFIKNVPEISNVDDPFKRHSKIVELLKKR